MKEILRMLIAPIIYYVCFVIIALAIQSYTQMGEFLTIMFSVLNLAFFMLCGGAVLYKEGENGFTKLLYNDVERRNIVETGKDIKLDTSAEYRPWKGFLTGIILCLPLIVFMIIHVITRVEGNTSLYSKLAEMIYSPFYVFFGNYTVSGESTFFYGSIAVIIGFPLILGVPYIIGAHRKSAQRKKAEEIDKILHGDKK